MIIHKNISLLPYNTFRLDVNAQYLVEVTKPEDLEEVYQKEIFRPLPKVILGGGSNVLLTGNQRKVVIKIDIKGIEVVKEDSHHAWVKVGAGENWHQFVMWAIDHNLAGIENLSLIPGTVGAAPMQNIGAYGVELKEVFDYLEAYDIKHQKIQEFTNQQCRFGYRYSIFKGELKDKFIITNVVFRLNKHPKYNVEYGDVKRTLQELGYQQLSIRAISEAIIHIRQNKLPDPVEVGNAGSFFKNPIIEKDHFDSISAAFEKVPSYPVAENWVKVPAAWLIENTGWKGKRLGEVGVHERQPLVLVNFGKGKGNEILKLSEAIQDSVQKKFGVDLQREVNVI